MSAKSGIKSLMAVISVCGFVCFNTSCRTAHEQKALHPAVLVTTWFQEDYFMKPLYKQGIELHTCDVADLPKLLPTGRYNVVVVTHGPTNEAVFNALNVFLKAGGGVMMLPLYPYDPNGAGGLQFPEDWLAREKFLEQYGAHFPIATIKENDTSKAVKSWNCDLNYTDRITAPWNEGVKGLLYLRCDTFEGRCPPVAIVADRNWQTVVQTPETAETVPFGGMIAGVKGTTDYIPSGKITGPTLLTVRQVKKGRLAALGISSEWLFRCPWNCPPVKQMMSEGCGGRPSNWLQLLANTFRWLAEPTLKAGKGGAPTPAEVVNPPIQRWWETPPADWSKMEPIPDQLQVPGLVGARSSYSGGKGNVEEWVNSAKAAGLKFLVFLEPLENITREDYEKLCADCKKFTDDTFFACPGLWFKDAYGKNNQILYGENAQYPLPNLLTQDGKFLDNSKAVTPGRMLFRIKYVYEQNGLKPQPGFFRHAENQLPVWEYKFYTVFVVHSTDNGKVVDDNLKDYDMLQTMHHTLTPGAVSLMDDPAQLQQVAREDWRTIFVNAAKNEAEAIGALRKRFSVQTAWHPPFLYITHGAKGPKILCWTPQNEIIIPGGEWFRPNDWRYRVRLHVASETGIKEIRLISAGKVVRRFLPGGAKDFDQTLELENSQQRDMYPIVQDVEGNEAVGMTVRNANCLFNEFISGDRCNFQSYGWCLTDKGGGHQYRSAPNSVTHNKGAWWAEVRPAFSLTLDYPILPTDGAPAGDKDPYVYFNPEISTKGFPDPNMVKGYSDPTMVNCQPRAVLASPDVIIGGGYLNNVIADPSSWGNAWSWWSGVKPNEFIEGYGQLTLFNCMPGGMRNGWYEFKITTRKDMTLLDNKLSVQFVKTSFTEFRSADGKVYKAGDKDMPETGPFPAGADILIEEAGGVAGLVSMDDKLCYTTHSGGNIDIGLAREGETILKGTPINCKIGILGAPAETPLKNLHEYFQTMGKMPPNAQVRQGVARADHIAIRIDGAKTGADLTLPANIDLRTFWTLVVDNMNENWGVWLLDRTLPKPNWRQLPVVDKTAYAVVRSDTDKDLFLGHPVLADDEDLVISVCNLPDRWQVTLHNPTDRNITTKVRSAKNWTPFTLAEEDVTVPAGSSTDVPLTSN
jgi:hypothetical protein